MSFILMMDYRLINKKYRHNDHITGPADGDSALAFRNINTNCVHHSRYSFEMY